SRAGVALLAEWLAAAPGSRAADGAVRYSPPRVAAAVRRGHPGLRPAELRGGSRRGRSAAAPAPAAAAVPIRPAQDSARDRRDPPAGRLVLRATGLARAARERPVHRHPYYWRHWVRQDVRRAVPLHRPTHPPSRGRP